MTLDQAAIMMGVRARHTRRILGAYREKGAAALLVDIIELMPAWGNIPVSNIEQFGMWMMVKRCRVRLAEEEQQELRGLVSKGRAAAYKQTHARILLLCDENQADGAMKDEEIARALKVGIATVERVRRRRVEAGVDAALGRKEQLNRRPKKLDGQGEAHLVALACAEPPPGRVGWTLKLLADRLVEWEIVASSSPETVRQTLKKRTQALAERVLVHPAARQRRVRLRAGRRAGSLAAPVPGQRSAGLPGPDQQTAGEGDPVVASGPAWGSRHLRLRVPAQRGEQSVHAVRSVGGVAPGGSDGPAHPDRLGLGGQVTGG